MTRRQPELGVHLPQQRVQRVGRVLVEVSSRLIGQQQRRLHDERPRHRHPLLLTTRQHARPMVEPLAEPHALEETPRPRPPLGSGHARDPERHLGVLERAELGQQVVKLEDEPDVTIAERHEPRIRQTR